MTPRALVFVILTASVLCASPASAADWHVPGDFATIQDAIDSPSVAAGDRIRVGPGSFDGARVTKSVHIDGTHDTVISNGPIHPSGLIQGFRLFAGSDGTTISGLTFTVDLAIINASYETVNDVTVTQNTIVNPVQGITNWLGSRWQITHNDIVDLRSRCGGGIGILVGDYNAGVVSDNLVSHNTVTGTLHVSPTDCGGYNGTGIVLYADFRFGRLGSAQISHNQVVHNVVSLTSDTPSVVDVVGIELTEADDPDPMTHVIYDNEIQFNDLTGTAMTIVLTPPELATVNEISHNSP
jgi:hypothetical protein